MILDESEYLAHYGILRRSGRYPWGSGDNAHGPDTPYQNSRKFLDVYEDFKAKFGLDDGAELAKLLGLVNHKGEGSTTQLREVKRIAKAEFKAGQIAEAQRLKDKGYGNTAGAEKMGIPESSYRALLKPGADSKAEAVVGTAELLKGEVDAKTYLDVGTGNENYMGVSETTKNTAIGRLTDVGYVTYTIKVPQPGTGEKTNVKVLCVPGTTFAEAAKAAREDRIGTLQSFSEDGGRTHFGIHPPLSISSDRVGVIYGDQGGSGADGVIYVRPGVEDISLGGSSYAQVRIKVDDHHYLKGMAVYKDDLPDGVDLMFNTNKKDTGNKSDAFKDMRDPKTGKVDPDNPFGAQFKRQIMVRDDDGNERVTSAMNIVREEGDWVTWTKSISSQMLSKQDPKLAQNQLNMTLERRKVEFAKIMATTNPTVKKKLLEEFADETDAAAVHLKAASLPRQRWQVILPVDTLGNNEIYAPHFNNGETVAVIRYPHGGTFEIPELTVNNKHAEARRNLGLQPRDAVGFNADVANRLSGADFDGDTVLVIPNDHRKITTTPSLEGLKNFDTKRSYPPVDGMRTIDGGRWDEATRSVIYGPKGPNLQTKQREMGDVSNLITDMTIQGANQTEIAAAVRHSMVVIDSDKHSLNYKQSKTDNGISALKERYQGGARRGASTLISRATSETRVPDRIERRAREGGPIDPVTGKRMYTETGKIRTNKKTGEESLVKVKSTKLAETDDAFTLTSGPPPTKIEVIYATHSNELKAMANQARLESLKLPPVQKNAAAAKTYESEVASLNAKLDLIQRNRPLERKATMRANDIVRQKKDANPNMDEETEKKIRNQSLEEARRLVGLERSRVVITDSEWDAIQAGAISETKLREILAKADMDVVKQHAIPREVIKMTDAKLNRAKDMIALGYTQAEIASTLGVSSSTLDRALHPETTE